jgi:hypothetical protein
VAFTTYPAPGGGPDTVQESDNSDETAKQSTTKGRDRPGDHVDM